MRGVAQGSVIIDPLDGGLLLVGKLKSQDPFELIELAKKYGGPGAVLALALQEIEFSLELGQLISIQEPVCP